MAPAKVIVLKEISPLAPAGSVPSVQRSQKFSFVPGPGSPAVHGPDNPTVAYAVPERVPPPQTVAEREKVSYCLAPAPPVTETERTTPYRADPELLNVNRQICRSPPAA